MSYPPPAAAGQALPQVAPQQQKVQAMPAQVHTAAPIIVNGSGPDTKPEKSNTPLIIFLVSLFTGFCCPCGFGYWVGSEIEHKKKVKKWNKKREKEREQDRAVMMAQAGAQVHH